MRKKEIVNATIRGDIREAIVKQSASEGTNVSQLTERLYAKYLKEKGWYKKVTVEVLDTEKV